MNQPTSETNPRTDIQALRGLAVLLVVFYHARLGQPVAGYLGVDIFFVISGFLITGVVKKSIEQDRFSFTQFYFRRAKRLLPAAYVTFLLTALCSPFILGSEELDDLVAQMIGAITFTANIVLWQQAGYFEGPAELKPLLHVWSLSIEEQYYFLLPATLVLIPRRLWLRATIAIAILSLALCVVGGYWKPIANFYLLPTRAWELAIGSIGAFLIHRPSTRSLARRLFWPSALVLAVIPFVGIGGNHPGIAALLVCLATLVLILDGRLAHTRSRPITGVARIGDMSYSLYLVHWPLFAFLANAWVGATPGDLPTPLGLATVALSFMLAYLLYRYVENPLRHADIRFSWPILRRTVVLSITLGALPFGLARAFETSTDFDHLRRVNLGLHGACDVEEFKGDPRCMTSPAASLLLWGDSYAMHLAPGLQAELGASAGMVQATRSACGPLLDLAPVESLYRKGYNDAWAESCIAFNDSVLEYLAEHPELRTVVLSSIFRPYLSAQDFHLLLREGEEFVSLEPGSSPAVQALARTIASIRALGRKVVIVAPPPSLDFNIGACLERSLEHRLVLGAPEDCTIDQKRYETMQKDVLDLLAEIERTSNVGIIRFDPALCSEGRCRSQLDQALVYRDAGHLSHDGSRVLAQRISLMARIDELAR